MVAYADQDKHVLRNPLNDFLSKEAVAGLILVACAAVALLLANSAYGIHYERFLAIPGSVILGPLEITKPLLLWVNDLWMAVFFFLIGLEVKREFLEGAFADRSALALPVVAALGGMIVPCLIYAFINRADPAGMPGVAIPAATDIAFALGIIALAGNRVPTSLKILLTAIAIIDDLGIIIVIAVFYTSDLSTVSLALAAVAVLALIVLNRMGVEQLIPYALIAAILWACVLKSGVHATLAGVVTAFAIPMTSRKSPDRSPLKDLEHVLHPWVAYLILPMFAFVNAGVAFGGVGLESFREPVTLGIVLGLFLGKQLGIFLPMAAMIRFGFAPMPAATRWVQLYGLAACCGIGFTMSLFLGGLAFEMSSFDAPVRLGVLTGSLLSAMLGLVLLRSSLPREPVTT